MAPLDQFIIFGDSITQFSENIERGFPFGCVLRYAYIRCLDVVNRGFSGYNSAQALVALPKFFPTPEQGKVRFLTVFFGANDAVLPDVKDRQYVSLEHYRDNLISIAQHPLVKAHEPRIILITPGPIDEYQQEINDREKGYTELRRTAANAKIYAEMTRKVAKELNVPVVDTWTAFMTKAGWKEGEPLVGSKECPPNSVLRELLLDGLHFDGPGYKILYEELMKSIEKEWPDQMPDKLEMPLPEWRTAPTIPYN